MPKPHLKYPPTFLQIELAHINHETGKPGFTVTRKELGRIVGRWKDRTAAQVERLQRSFLEDIAKHGADVPAIVDLACLEAEVKENGLTMAQMDRAAQLLGMEVCA
jgi:hypothetical protein